MKYLRFIFLALYLTVLVLIIKFAASSAEKSTTESNMVTEVVITVADAVTPGDTSIKDKFSMEQITTFVRKGIGHFGMFMALGFFGFLTYYCFIKLRLLRYLISFISGLVVAASSEIIQIFAESRGPAVADVLLDYSGYIIGSLLMFLIIFVIVLIKKKKGVLPYAKL